MRITVNPVLDMETLQWVSNDGVYEYDGPVVFAKGDPLAKEEEQQTVDFDQQLMTIFTAQYNTQQTQLAYLQKQMEPIINAGGTGYTPTQLAAMRTSASDTDAESYQQAQDALNNQISQASGGSKLTGVAGANVESDAALNNAEAQKTSSDQLGITVANANLQQTNYWNAINALNGVATEENPLGYAGSSNSAGGDVANLSEAVTASEQSQLLGALGGIAGGVGSALGGGFSKGGLFGCFIAASFFGWNSIKTFLVRRWLLTRAPGWFRKHYLKHGKRIAKTPLRWMYRPLFEFVLSQEIA